MLVTLAVLGTATILTTAVAVIEEILIRAGVDLSAEDAS